VIALLLAAACALTAFDGDVKVGHAGDWKKPSAGVPLSGDAQISLALGAHATVKLPDGSTRVLAGRAVVPVKRLLEVSSKVLLSEAVRRETFADFSKDAATTETATRGAGVGAEPVAMRRRRTVTFMGEEEEQARASSDADFAESRLRLSDPAGAIDYAWLVVADPDSAPLDRMRAHVVLGRAAIDDALPEQALAEFEWALSGAPATGSHADDLRADALLQRGQARMQLGSDDAARTDFEEAARLAPHGATAAHAQFFLGALALARSEPDEAKRRFASLSAFPELAGAAAELMSAASP